MLYEASLGNSETIVVDEESCNGGRSVPDLRTQLGHRRGGQNERRTIAAAYGVDKTG